MALPPLRVSAAHPRELAPAPRPPQLAPCLAPAAAPRPQRLSLHPEPAVAPWPQRLSLHPEPAVAPSPQQPALRLAPAPVPRLLLAERPPRPSPLRPRASA